MGRIELSGIGWIDGKLHVQTHISDNQVKAKAKPYDWYYYLYNSYVYLCDREGGPVYEEFAGQQRENVAWVRWEDGDDIWEERIFPVRQDEKGDYMLEAENEYMRAGVEDLLQYEWAVSFPADIIRNKAQ